VLFVKVSRRWDGRGGEYMGRGGDVGGEVGPEVG